MDLTVRDWMVIVGAVLILAVLLDAYRRVRTERRAKIRMSMNRKVTASSSVADESLLWPKELPNGGARVVGRKEIELATAQSRQNAQSRSESETNTTDEQDSVEGMSSSDEPENLDWLDNMGAEDADVASAQESSRRNRAVDPEVFMVNVVSREADGFKGEDILHILLACDLRFGEMNFFHRHEREAGRGPIQFSVANMVQPGVFDIDNMSDFSTSGLVFFLSLPGPDDMMQAFDYMLETAQAVARNLGGDVLDETRSVITKQTLEHARQKIRDLERRMLTSAAR